MCWSMRDASLSHDLLREKPSTLHHTHAVTQVCFEVVGYLLEELRDGKNYEQFQKDIADANIFIGSLIFIEELAEKVSRQGCFIC